MSNSDPMTCAARVAGMSDTQIFTAFHALSPDSPPTDFEQAVLDEAQFRGMLTGSEAEAVRRQ